MESSAPYAPQVRVIALGDEVLAGEGDPRTLGWIGRAIAKAQGPHARISLYSAALPQQTSATLADRWDRVVQERFDATASSEGRVSHRVVVALGSGDIEQGISLARSRLNLAKVLDGLERMRIPAFVVGPPPTADRGRNPAVIELSGAFEDVCARRRVPYVDAARSLEGHDQWMSDLARSDTGMPGQTGYGLIAWLVLHAGFEAWLGTEA